MQINQTLLHFKFELAIFYSRSRKLNNLKVHPLKSLVALLEDRSVIRLWNFELKTFEALKEHHHGIVNFCFSSDGSSLFTIHNDSSVGMWLPYGNSYRLEDSRVECASFGGEGEYSCIAATKSGIIAIGNIRGSVGIWNTQGKFVKSLEGHLGRISDIRFYVDGKRLITCSEDASLRILNIQENESITLHGHQEPVISFGFGPLGYLLSWSIDKTVRIWSGDGKFSEVIWNSSNNIPIAVRYAKESQYIQILDSSGTLYALNLNLQKLMRQASLWIADSLKISLDSAPELQDLHPLIHKLAQESTHL